MRKLIHLLMASRIYYLDGIKVFLSFMVVAHHAGQSYGDTGGAWLIFDEQQVEGLRHFFFINASYLMSFYFFISGYFTFSSLQKNNLVEFMRNRFYRLGIPLLFISLFVFIPLHYFMDDSTLSFLSFVRELYFEKPPLAFGHLWFVASLLMYSLLFGLFFHYVSIRAKKFTYQWWFPLVFILFSSISSYVVRNFYAVDQWVTWLIPLEPAHLPIYLLSFYVGVLSKQQDWLPSLSFQNSLPYLILLFVFVGLQNGTHFITDGLLIEVVYESLIVVGVSLFLLTFFKAFLNFDRGVIRNIATQNYGIYLVHLFFVLLFQYAFLSVNLSGIVKFVVVTFLAFFTSWLFSFFLRKLPFVKQII